MPVTPGRPSRKHALPGAPAMIGAALSLLCAGWFAASSLAGYHEFAARSFVDAWDYQNRLLNIVSKTYTPKPLESIQAARHADMAVGLAPWNADAHLTAGSVYLWESAAPLPGSNWKTQSLSLLRRACEISPARSDLWVKLARAKFIAGELDAEFSLALQNAGRLGPWRPSNLYEVTEIGLAAWSHLDPATMQSVAATITRSQSWNAADTSNTQHAQSIRELTLRFNRLTEVCALLPQAARSNHGFCTPPLQPGQT